MESGVKRKAHLNFQANQVRTAQREDGLDRANGSSASIPTEQRIRCTNRRPLDILLVVPILFAISIICLAALIGAGAAIVRHVRLAQRPNHTPAPPAPSFTEHWNAATTYGTLRSPRVVPHQSVQGITAKKHWNTPSQSVEIHPKVDPDFQIGGRKPPTSADRSSERADWAFFNKDFGDLTDPSPSRPYRIASDRRTSST